MKKVTSLLLALLLGVLCTGCGREKVVADLTGAMETETEEETKIPRSADAQALLADVDALSQQLMGKSCTEVHDLLGEPDGSLHGFFADVYFGPEEQWIRIDYNADGNVEKVSTEEP